jgi:hypothetical protein
VHFLEFLEPIIAIGDTHSAVQHEAGLTHKSQPSVMVSWGFCPKPRQAGVSKVEKCLEGHVHFVQKKKRMVTTPLSISILLYNIIKCIYI